MCDLRALALVGAHYPLDNASAKYCAAEFRRVFKGGGAGQQNDNCGGLKVAQTLGLCLSNSYSIKCLMCKGG